MYSRIKHYLSLIHLDSVTENAIQNAIETFSRDRTVLVIAHRLATVKNADNIIVMNQGKVVDQGTNNILMAKNGAYKKIVESQTFELKNEISSNKIKAEIASAE